MLKPIDRSRRDGPLYPGSTRTLLDFIDRKHLLRRIDANFDFASLAEFLQALYDPWIGRPALHPEVVIRALILMAVYQVPSETANDLAYRVGQDPRPTRKPLEALFEGVSPLLQLARGDEDGTSAPDSA